MSTFDVIGEIYEERRAQAQREGFTDSHDDAHDGGSLARAAACYALGDKRELVISHDGAPLKVFNLAERLWPWEARWWKPKSRRRDLIRAAALIVAEIERLDRAARKAA